MRFAPVSRTSAARKPPSIRPTIICGAVVFSRVSAASRSNNSPGWVVCSAAYSSTWSLTMKAISAREASDSSDAAEQHAAVVAAEAHRIRERNVDLRFARLVRDVVEIALGIGVLVVDRGRDRALVDREHAHHRLDRAGGSEAVAHHRFRR